jgi:hypothetical protein
MLFYSISKNSGGLLYLNIYFLRLELATEGEEKKERRFL